MPYNLLNFVQVNCFSKFNVRLDSFKNSVAIERIDSRGVLMVYRRKREYSLKTALTAEQRKMFKKLFINLAACRMFCFATSFGKKFGLRQLFRNTYTDSKEKFFVCFRTFGSGGKTSHDQNVLKGNVSMVQVNDNDFCLIGIIRTNKGCVFCSRFFHNAH